MSFDGTGVVDSITAKCLGYFFIISVELLKTYIWKVLIGKVFLY